MEFYWNKFRELRKKNRIPIIQIISKMKISRPTYWLWEHGKRLPDKDNVRTMAKLLDVPVSVISDLEDEAKTASHSTDEILSMVSEHISLRNHKVFDAYDGIIDIVSQLKHKIMSNSMLLNAMMCSVNAIFYIKDIKLNYITVNELFLKNLSFDPDFRCFGKTDEVFFTREESMLNTIEDKEVLVSGIPVINREGIIPGTKKKRLGLISKYPMFDAERKVYGIVGTFIDITEMKRNEEIREILEKALNLISPSITVYDCEKNKMVFLSRDRVEKMTGYPADMFIKGVEFYRTRVLYPGDSSAFNTKFEDNDGIKSREFQFRIINKKGEVRQHNAIESYIRIFDKDYIVGVTTDITEKTQTDERNMLMEKFMSLEPYVPGIIDINSDKHIFIGSNIESLSSDLTRELFHTKTIRDILVLIKNRYEIRKSSHLVSDESASSKKPIRILHLIHKNDSSENIRIEYKCQKVNNKFFIFHKIYPGN